MTKSRTIITLGVIIALLPLLGFPRAWESFFQVATGLSIVLFSLWASVDKKLTLKAKAQKRQAHKRMMAKMAQQEEEPSVEPINTQDDVI